MSFNENNPPTGTLLVSGDMRANFDATRKAVGAVNMLIDPLFECWPTNDTTVPAAYTLTGTGASISRLTAAADVAVGKMSARVTFGSAAAILAQKVLAAADYDTFFNSKVVTAACHIKTSTASIARIRIDDGVTFSNSSFHTGGGAFEILTVEHTVDPTATKLELQMRVEAAGNAIFSGPTFLFSDIKPARFIPGIVLRPQLVFPTFGNAEVAQIHLHQVGRPAVVEFCQLRGRTAAPTGADLIGDLNQWDGASLTSMYTAGGRPKILAAASPIKGGAAPDGTYNRRCLRPTFGAGADPAGAYMTLDIDQVGATTPGQDIIFYVQMKTWATPREAFALHNSFGL